jgi:putative transposase
MQLTQQIKIRVTPSQEIVLKALSEKCRLIYNFSLDERKEAFDKCIKGINYLKQQNDLPKIKEKYPEYRWVYSKVLQYTLRTLDADFKSFFSLKKKGDKDARPPKYKGKQFFTTMVYNQSGYRQGKGWIELSHKHPIGTKLWFRIPDRFVFNKIYQVSIYKKDKEYYLSVTYEKKEEDFKDNNLYQAFDLGLLKQTAVNTSGRFIEFKNQRPDRYWSKCLSDLQGRRDHCKRFSRKFWKLNKQLTFCKRKSANQLRDFQHKLSRKIISNTKASTIIVGDISPKKMCQRDRYKKAQHASLQNTGTIGRIARFLTYKGMLAGKRVVEISERDTSKKCFRCANEQEMPLEKREYICGCGNKIDRDKNSAINIMVRYLSQNGLWTAYWQFVSNLRQTGLTIVSHPQEASSLGTR